MDLWVALVGGVILLAVGGWTVTHPNGGYRAAGGAGSGLSPSTRRFAGMLLMAFAAVVMLVAVAEAI